VGAVQTPEGNGLPEKVWQFKAARVVVESVHRPGFEDAMPEDPANMTAEKSV